MVITSLAYDILRFWSSTQAVKTAGQRDQVEHLLTEAGKIYLDVWVFGLNTALRVSDILSITMDQVRKLDPALPVLELTEQKTGKRRRVTLNRRALEVAQRRLRERDGDMWLFQSDSRRNRKSDPKPITRRSIARVFETVGKQIVPRVRLSTHSMRKTRGYAMHSAGMPIEAICKVLNHSHPAITMRYIGLDDTTVQQSYTDFVL